MAQPGICHKVTFLPENTTIEVPDRITIFEAIFENNPQKIQLNFACGAEGICRKCKIRTFQKMGPLTPTEKGCLTEEELKKGIRLACQARVIQDTQVEILYKMPFSISRVDETIQGISLNPRIVKLYCPPGRDDPVERLLERLQYTDINDDKLQQVLHPLQEKFFDTLREKDGDCTVVIINQEVVALEDGDTTEQQYAIAVDIGINTLVASLLDVHSGRKIAVVTDTNPQIEFGKSYEQRVSMIEENTMNLEVLHEELLLRIDVLIVELCRACEVDPSHVYEIVVSGSTGMLHLFLKDVTGLMEQSAVLRSPTKSSTVPGVSARHFNFKTSEHARVYALPVISAYAGADVTAGILATQLHRSSETAILLDFGSDIKAVMHHCGSFFATSLPGYGVFDGTGISCGMRPEHGAAYRVHIDTSVQLEVIGESLPRGICSGCLVELGATLKQLGIIDEKGNFSHESSRVRAAGCGDPALCIIKGQPAFRLYSAQGDFETDIYITRDDVLQLQKVKAVTIALLRTVIAAGNIEQEKISRIIISGAFETEPNIEAFFSLGFLPLRFSGKVLFAGNTSKRGAQMALLDRMMFAEAEEIVRQTRFITPPQCIFSEEDLLLVPVA